MLLFCFSLTLFFHLFTYFLVSKLSLVPLFFFVFDLRGPSSLRRGRKAISNAAKRKGVWLLCYRSDIVTSPTLPTVLFLLHLLSRHFSSQSCLWLQSSIVVREGSPSKRQYSSSDPIWPVAPVSSLRTSGELKSSPVVRYLRQEYPNRP